MEDTYQFRFKGDDFENLYRIEGTLTTKSPVHIGTGETRPDLETWKTQRDKGEIAEDEKPHEIGEIERDYQGMPILPGSALRGVARHYLLSLFRSFNDGKIASDPDYEDPQFKSMNQAQQKEYMYSASLLEQLFGTPFCESKIEFWDAPLIRKAEGNRYATKGWDAERQTYMVRSVAIDPVTGAAERNKLYSFDVTPPGLEFRLNIVGRNLSEPELGMLLFGVEGFNSPIYPLTIGAMAGRGFGQMSFKLENIYRLKKEDLSKWMDLAINTDSAGYILLSGLKLPDTEAGELIRIFKSKFNELLGEKKK